MVRRSSPRFDADGSPRLRDLPSAPKRLPHRATARASWRLRRTPLRRRLVPTPEGANTSSCYRSWGSSSFRLLATGTDRRLAPGHCRFRPFPRCTPAPRSLHSLPLQRLTRVAIPPLVGLRSPGFLPSGRLLYGSRLHTPLSSLGPRTGSSCLARHDTDASQGPLGLPVPDSAVPALSRRTGPVGSAPRRRAAVVSPRPQGTSAGSGPACRRPPVRRRSLDLASGVLPGLVLMRGRDRLPHPSTPFRCRRSPSGSHPRALVPVSRATHTWSASSP
jgi:hypothetical protein